MSKYKVIYYDPDTGQDLFEEDEIFDTERAAEDAGDYGCSCCSLGAEIFHMSNPGDYPESDSDLDYYVKEV